MKIIFAGTPEFALAPLRAIVEGGFDVVGVITQEDKPQGRKGVLTPPPVKTRAGGSLRVALTRAALSSTLIVYTFFDIKSSTFP